MKAVSRNDAPIVIDGDGVEVRVQEIGGGMSTSFIRLPQGADLGPALKGLAGDSCPCPHWGYIISGRLQMRTADGDFVYETGQAVYWAPGHIPMALQDTQYVDFSPTNQFNQVVSHIQAQGG